MATIQLRVSTKVEKTIGKAELMLRFFHGKIDLRSKTGIYIKPESWNKEKECLKIPRYATPEQVELTKLQSKIDELTSLIANSFVSTSRDKINDEWLDALITKFNFPEKYEQPIVEEVRPQMLFSYIASFIEQAPKRRHKETGRLLIANNLQQYKATQKHLIAFAEISHKEDFKFSELNHQFYDDFVVYLQNPIQKTENGEPVFDKEGNPVLTKKSFTQNSVGKHIKVLKVMLNDAPKELVAESDYDGFYVYTEDVDNVYLNEVELQLLKDFDFSGTPHLERVRDWFLLLAWTGSRFSDLAKITLKDVSGDFISYRQQKTNMKVVIPLHTVVKEILGKYKFQMPEPISNQKFNEYIKDACKQAQINSIETFTRTVGGKLVSLKLPKCDLVSSHTCRRSFCTNMYKRGLPTLMIMSISGHKTEKSFLKYIKIKQSEHAELMAAAWKNMY
jgi:integrase